MGVSFWILTFVLVAAHAAMVAASLPLIRGRIAPNRTFGFRTTKTLSDERIWYAANAAAGRWMLLATVVSAVFAIVYLGMIREPLAPVAPLFFLAFALLASVVASFVSLGRIAT